MSEKPDPLQANNDPPTLRAMRFGELLDTTFSLYRTHFWSFLGIAAGYFMVMVIGTSIRSFIALTGRSGQPMIWISITCAVVGVSVVVISGLVFACSQAYLGEAIRIGVALRRATRQFWRCFVGLFIYTVLATLFTFLAALPLGGILNAVSANESLTIAFGLIVICLMVGTTGWFLTYWCFFVAAVLVEGKLIWPGLRRRRELLGRARWRIVGMMFGILLLAFVVAVILRATFAFPLTFSGLEGLGDFFDNVGWMVFWRLPIAPNEFQVAYLLMYVINFGIDTFTLPIWVIGGTLLYFDQRIRKEGFDIEVMATYQAGDSDARTI